jgi:hypothetical protein
MAYKASFNSFSEMVLDNGTVIRRIENAGGATYSIVAEDVNPDDFMTNEGAEGDWLEADEEEAAYWLESAQA